MENDFELEQVSVRLVKDSPLYSDRKNHNGRKCSENNWKGINDAIRQRAVMHSKS
ncbi:MAG: hypothetical protein ACLUR5_03525 [Eubacterium ventriosum]